MAIERDYYGAFPQRMRELGYVDGRNLEIEWRFADGRYERLAALADDLVQRAVDAILALGPPGALAAHRATRTIPIVIVTSSDPVADGLVHSLARPGGNVTGLVNLGVDLSAKHVEMLVDMLPRLKRLALLVNDDNKAHASVVSTVQAAARALRVEALPIHARSASALDDAFAAMARERVQALIVAIDPLFIQHVPDIAQRAANARLPSIFTNREYAEAGGLMSYGQNQVEIYRRAAGYVDRILRGARPGDLPMEQPAELELVINQRAAKALDVVVPAALRARASVI